MNEVGNKYCIIEFKYIPINTVFRYESKWWKKNTSFSFSNKESIVGVRNTNFVIAVPESELPKNFIKNLKDYYGKN